jgi:hypothetical protein
LGITDIESALPSRKTADPYHFADRCEVNEDYTSKVCCLRHQQINECIKVVDGFSGLRVSLWGVLQCQNCHQIWNRDKNACTNIAYLANLERTGHERPAVFSRQIQYVPPPSTSSEGASNQDSTDAALDPTLSQQPDGDSVPLNL